MHKSARQRARNGPEEKAGIRKGLIRKDRIARSGKVQVLSWAPLNDKVRNTTLVFVKILSSHDSAFRKIRLAFSTLQAVSALRESQLEESIAKTDSICVALLTTSRWRLCQIISV